MQQRINKGVGRHVIYLLAFLFTLHITPAIHIESSFLAQFVPTKMVGLFFSIASIISIVSFFYIRHILRRFGNYRTFLVVLTIEFLMLACMMLSTTAWMVLTAFVISSTMRTLGFFHLDLFLEDVSTNKETGGIRGLYLTIMNLSFIIGPLIASSLLTDSDYWKIFALSSTLLLPVFYLVIRYVSAFKDPAYRDPEFAKTVKHIFKNKDLRNIFSINALLYFFYAWMVIYTPVYLVQVVGFSLSEMMFSIALALVAFVLIQIPLGHISDTYIGEKEFLITGFIIMAIATGALAFITSESFWVWTFVLFMTRVGASMVEVMSESYFFKKVDSSDLSFISVFRMLLPFMYMAAPLIASILLFMIDIRFLFLILGAMLLYGVRFSLVLKDTK